MISKLGSVIILRYYNKIQQGNYKRFNKKTLWISLYYNWKTELKGTIIEILLQDYTNGVP